MRWDKLGLEGVLEVDWDDQVARTALALGCLMVASLAVMRAGGIGLRGDLLLSAARAVVQLALVALVIAWLFANPQWSPAYITIMLGAATFTAVRRIGCGRRHSWPVLLSIAAGAAATVGIVAATGALSRDVQSLLPFTAQMIGGAMTATLLAGARLRDDALERWSEIEGYLALGARPREAVRPIATRAVEQSLAPALDQMKSAGLVLLPGSFVGLLLGGASPMLAVQIQLLVLVGLVLAQVISSVLTAHLLSAAVGSLKPELWRR
jgi:putative ABC transport system permease protein